MSKKNKKTTLASRLFMNISVIIIPLDLKYRLIFTFHTQVYEIKF